MVKGVMFASVINSFWRKEAKLLFFPVGMFRAEKRTAQLSAHPLPYLRARVVMQIAKVERKADC